MDFDDLNKKDPGGADMGDDPIAGGGSSEDFGYGEDKPAEEFGFNDETVAAPQDEPGEFDFNEGSAEPNSLHGGEGSAFNAPAGPTSFFGYFGKGLRMALLKGDAAEEVAADPGAFIPALVVYAFPSLIAGLILFLLPGVLFQAMIHSGDATQAPPGFNAMLTVVKSVSASLIFILPLFAIIGSLISTGILHLIAKLFKGEGRFFDYYQTIGVGSLVSWGGILPFVGMLFSLWMLPVLVVITSRVHNMSIGRAVAVVLLPIVLFVVIVIAVFSTMIMALMGTHGMHTM